MESLSNQTSGSGSKLRSKLSDNYQGFITNVDVRDKYPITSKASFLIRPGKENHVTISAVNVEADEDIKIIKS